MQRVILSAAFACFAISLAAAQGLPYDHIHLNVPDPAVASVWYEKYFGARRLSEGPDQLMFGSSRVVFTKKADAKPSAGSVVDHLGFSFARSRSKDERVRRGGHQDRHARA